jgi:MFS family permease
MTNDTPQAGRFSGWWMVAIFFLAQNTVYGFLFGTYGILMSPVGTELGAANSIMSLGLPLVMVGQGLLAPVAAWGIGRFSIRVVMIAGALLLSLGFLLVATAHDPWQFVLAFGVLGGAAGACLGAMTGTTLVGNWFVEKRGLATGLGMVPLFMMLVPFVATPLIAQYGWRHTAYCIAAVALLLLPVLWFVRDRPADVGQRALGATDADAGAASGAAAAGDGGALREPFFWLFTVFAAIVTAASIVITTYLVNFAISEGIEQQSAGKLLGYLAILGFPGALVFGAVADRIGGGRTLALLAALQFVAWPCLLLKPSYWVLVALIGVIGLSANGTTPAGAALLANRYGQGAFAKVMGVYTMASMPIYFLVPIAAGVLLDATGGYHVMFLAQAALLGASMLALFALGMRERRAPVVAAVAAA